MTGFFNLLKSAQEMQSKMGDLQAELLNIEVEGKAGAGLVAVTANGKGEVKKVSIDPSLLKPEEVKVLEDLLVKAIQEAKTKAEERLAERFANLAGFSLPPGMKLPF